MKSVSMVTVDAAKEICGAGASCASALFMAMCAEICALENQNRTLESQKSDLAKLHAKDSRIIVFLEGIVAHLCELLSKNTRNSDKPPSTDTFKKDKPHPKSLRTPSGRHPGGQPGHEGHRLVPSESPDVTVSHKVTTCEVCGHSLEQQVPERQIRRQVFEIPDPKIVVTEHLGEVKTCPCGHVNQARFPEGVTSEVQYGPNIKATVVYLSTHQFLPAERLQETMIGLFGCTSFSQGTLENILAECGEKVAPAEEVIREMLVEAKVAGFDETPIRGPKGPYWIHSVSTPLLTWYFPHQRRGAEGMKAAGILQRFFGRAMHDFWKAYNTFTACFHCFCTAHLQRELVFVWEVLGQKWAELMMMHLNGIRQVVKEAKEAGETELDPETIAGLERGYRSILARGYDENPPTGESATPAPDVEKKRGRRKQSKALNLLDRMRDNEAGILRFMREFDVPSDNNLAERDLRMMKLRQKISGTFRSLYVLKDFCRIRSYISTARKNGLTALEALRLSFSGKPFIPGQTTE